MTERVCLYCGRLHQIEAQFCPETGKPLGVALQRCSSCGNQYSIEDDICPHCGNRKSETESEIRSTLNGEANYKDVHSQRKKLIWAFVVLMLFAVGIVGGILGGWRQHSSAFVPTHRATSALPETPSPLFITVTATPTQILIITPSRIVVTTPYSSPTVTLTATPRPTSTRTLTPTDDSWQACRNTYASRLHIGDQAYVGFDPPYPNNVREEPGMDAEIIGKINPGEEILIIDGPACANNWVWWLMRSRKTGLVGWTAEGDIEGYWLVPLSEE